MINFKFVHMLPTILCLSHLSEKYIYYYFMILSPSSLHEKPHVIEVYLVNGYVVELEQNSENFQGRRGEEDEGRREEG